MKHLIEGKTYVNRTKPWVDLIKLFWHKFTYSFLQARDIFKALQQIVLSFIKWSSLQKGVSKFRPKKFNEIDPRAKFSSLDVSMHGFMRLGCVKVKIDFIENKLGHFRLRNKVFNLLKKE